MKNFGIERVIDRPGDIPVTAWKLDNSSELKAGEARIRLECVDFERESIDQLASAADYEYEAICSGILNMIKDRGKVHNPYTGSGGLFAGIIEEASPDFGLEEYGLKVGDRVAVATSTAGLPARVTKINSIDLNYGHVKADGYAIVFDPSTLKKLETCKDIDIKHFLRGLNEEGSLEEIAEELKKRKAKRLAIIGSRLAESIFYAQMMRFVDPEADITFIIDNSHIKNNSEKQIRKVFEGLTDRMYVTDVTDAYKAYERISEQENNVPFDSVVCLDNIRGCESLSALLTRDGGMIGLISLNSGYAQTLLINDSVGKEIFNYAGGGFRKTTFEFLLGLASDVEPYLKKLDKYYSSMKPFENLTGSPVKNRETQVHNVDDFIYMSPITANMIDEVLNVSRYDCNVILQGETGVGKERVCDIIHRNSTRRDKPLIKINCATIQETLAESEFFGYEKGSFTGADSHGKAGYFELANNGILFLDEIGSLALDMQAKLLRVLQENTYYRVGGTELKHVNVRVICANNVPLKKLIEENRFREDLYYRLKICQITIPPLRERKEDIVCLAEAFMNRFSETYGIEKHFSVGVHTPISSPITGPEMSENWKTSSIVFTLWKEEIRSTATEWTCFSMRTHTERP